jgi:hypothetical protein
MCDLFVSASARMIIRKKSVNCVNAICISTVIRDVCTALVINGTPSLKYLRIVSQKGLVQLG